MLDVGAGDAPFRELFAHTSYATLDWGSPCTRARAASTSSPRRTRSRCATSAFDAVLLTQVLEHVPEPAAVMRELHRILAPAGGST